MTWYRIHQRDLPWRRTRSAYRIWVSEVMLQQTQVETVIPYYRRFIRRFPSLSALASSDLEAVLKVWEGLGYYSRARHLLEASQIIARDYRGRIPRDLQVFLRLPGVGDYIGAAVLSIAFQKPYAAVDGNVKRVLSRLQAIDLPMNASASSRVFKHAAQALLDRDAPGISNQAFMEFGALQCIPRNPLCNCCPLRRLCKAYQSNTVKRLPNRGSRRTVPTRHVAVGVVYNRDRVLITRRAPRGLLGGLWEFPGGAIGADESARAACLREIREETGLSVTVGDHLATVRHAYTHFKVVIDVFRCAYQGGTVHLSGPVDFRWVSIAELDQFAFPSANKKFMHLLIRR
ncbi:MAG: A/G-specific adenine glycosylase [Deltaproteobacteria bacterium]|nr:A/G-specific adenine glycosylase [Deltaproteobacteria bacterium]